MSIANVHLYAQIDEYLAISLELDEAASTLRSSLYLDVKFGKDRNALLELKIYSFSSGCCYVM